MPGPSQFLILLPTCFIWKSSLWLSKCNSASFCSSLSDLPLTALKILSPLLTAKCEWPQTHHCSIPISPDIPSFDDLLSCSPPPTLLWSKVPCSSSPANDLSTSENNCWGYNSRGGETPQDGRKRSKYRGALRLGERMPERERVCLVTEGLHVLRVWKGKPHPKRHRTATATPAPNNLLDLVSLGLYPLNLK